MKKLLSAVLVGICSIAGAAERPNVIFILADDLGYGDYGAFYQNLRKAKGDRSEPWHVTPNLDRFAAEGLQLRGHYCGAPVCAPSRASLLLGVHQGHANVRDNQFDKALEDNHTLGTVMRGAGYATAAIGKWGLQGGPPERSPEAERAQPKDLPGFPTHRGFDYYFGYLSHYDGHFHYPKEDGRHIWDGEREISKDLAGCYTTDLFTARAKKWISDQRARKPKQPFFLYLAYDTPHAKLLLLPGEFPARTRRQGRPAMDRRAGAHDQYGEREAG
jgi:arylsulfatase A-like enzyme